MLILIALGTVDSINAFLNYAIGSTVIAGGTLAHQYNKYLKEEKASLESIDREIAFHEECRKNFSDLEQRAQNGEKLERDANYYRQKKEGDESWIASYQKQKKEAANNTFSGWLKHQPKRCMENIKSETAATLYQLRRAMDEKGCSRCKEIDDEIGKHRKNFWSLRDLAKEAEDKGNDKEAANFITQYEEKHHLIEQLIDERNAINDRIETSPISELLKNRLLGKSN